MPIIVRLQYCVIHMYFDDHNPPHFHIDTPDRGAVMAIKTLKVIDGAVDARAEREAREWATQNLGMLLGLWKDYNP